MVSVLAMFRVRFLGVAFAVCQMMIVTCHGFCAYPASDACFGDGNLREGFGRGASLGMDDCLLCLGLHMLAFSPKSSLKLLSHCGRGVLAFSPVRDDRLGTLLQVCVKPKLISTLVFWELLGIVRAGVAFKSFLLAFVVSFVQFLASCRLCSMRNFEELFLLFRIGQLCRSSW